jgi:hypothetical protein
MSDGVAEAVDVVRGGVMRIASYASDAPDKVPTFHGGGSERRLFSYL